MKKIFISPLTLLLIILFWVMGKGLEILILFIVITTHEFSHILAAWYYNIKLEKISITPIGAMVKISSTSFKNSIQEIVVYLAGPFSNIVMAVLGYILNSYFLWDTQIMSFFILLNISLLILNLLPVLPLDGGRVFRVLLLRTLGYNLTNKVFITFSRILSIFLIILGVFQFGYNWYNLSLLFLGVFIYLNLYKQKDEIHYLLMSELFNKKRNLNVDGVIGVKYIACFDKKSAVDIIKSFYSRSYHIIKVFNQDLKEIGEVSETQLLECVVDCNMDITLGEVVEYVNKKFYIGSSLQNLK